MAKPDTGIFQLSLAELAFMLVFVLLLLLGWMISKFEEDKKQLEIKIAEAGDINSNFIRLDEAKVKLSEALSRNGVKPDEIISELISQKEIVREREALRKRVEDLDARVTMLAEVQKIIKEGSGQYKDKKQIVEEHIDAALIFHGSFTRQLDKSVTNMPKAAHAFGMPLQKASAAREAAIGAAFKAALENELGAPIQQGMEAEVAKELVQAAKQLPGDALSRKENADLRGQVAFLKGKLEARGGRDYPPCWADEKTGRIEFLFEIEIHPDGLLITPAWPPNREQDARTLPGIDQLLVTELQSLKELNHRMHGIDRQSKEKSCRHYIQMRNHVNELDVFNQYRFGIENFFYKLELR